MKLTGKSTSELLAIRKARPFTEAEKRELRGTWPDTAQAWDAYTAELVRRLQNGEALSRADKRAARAALLA